MRGPGAARDESCSTDLSDGLGVWAEPWAALPTLSSFSSRDSDGDNGLKASAAFPLWPWLRVGLI